MAILPGLQGPADLRGLSETQLQELADEIRRTIIATVAVTGGHLGSSLGVVEITLALHRILESPRDRIVWDTGHQAYPHKLLTGRYAQFGTLRQLGGIGGFPRRSESEHDVFDGGHAGTGLSIAAGLATARDVRHGMERIAVVVGDAALMSGLSLEALNDLGHRRTPDPDHPQRQRDVDQPIGGGALAVPLRHQALHRLAAVEARLRPARGAGADGRPDRPGVQPPRAQVGGQLAQPGQLFEDLGITYIGVVPGHDLRTLEHTFRSALAMDVPVLVHVRTQKGRGYRPAEKDQVSFHGAALPPVGRLPRRAPGRWSGEPPGSRRDLAGVLRGIARATAGHAAAAEQAASEKRPRTTPLLAQEVIAAAREDREIVAITAGMPTGTGLNRFQAEFPDRFVDVGIAEQHAVALATGIALGGGRPVVAIYATFLQRAFDQIVHDAAQNNQPILIGVDRAGLVGEDGTHRRASSRTPRIARSRTSSSRRRRTSRSSARWSGPRWPGSSLRPRLPARPSVRGARQSPRSCPSARARSCAKVARFGSTAWADRGARNHGGGCARGRGWSVGVINARFLKPIDGQLILDQARGKRLVVTLEEGTAIGGSAPPVLEVLEEARLADPPTGDRPCGIIGHSRRPVRGASLRRRPAPAHSPGRPWRPTTRCTRRWRSCTPPRGLARRSALGRRSRLTPSRRANTPGCSSA